MAEAQTTRSSDLAVVQVVEIAPKFDRRIAAPQRTALPLVEAYRAQQWMCSRMRLDPLHGNR